MEKKRYNKCSRIKWEIDNMYNTYSEVLDGGYKIKMEFMERFINPELVFVEIHDGQVFHIMIMFDNKLRLIVFNEDEFSKLHDGGRVVSFNDNHEGLNARSSDKQKIYDYLKVTLPPEKFHNFEKWAITNL